jgi:hypothetical protein
MQHEEVRQQEGMRQLNSSREFFPAQVWLARISAND